ncbi:MAG: relaxase domain-containing protein, partial [Proteobacteria bacterium]|nr:relaxase domain-containing protein [Pseudomonadota bacterium]
MLSISPPLSASRAGAYFAKDDYYLAEKGTWWGRGAEALGLTGEVTREDFAAVLAKTHPETGAVLVPGQGDAAQAGIDLTFSAPKSVSILALADATVVAAHRRAVAITLAYAEAHNAQARRQKNGVREIVATGNLVVATFDHATSRELDPQLHTHAVVANVIQRDDGAWRALHNSSFFRDKMHLGRVYRSEFARELKDLGYAPTITDPEKGIFEVQGVPQDLLEAFSQRRAQVEERFGELKASGAYPHASDAVLRHQAALDTRRWKGTVDRASLAQEWQAVLERHGTTLGQVREVALREGAREREAAAERSPGKPTRDLLREAARLWTETESVFSRKDVLDLALRTHLGGPRLSEWEQAFRGLRRSSTFVSLGTDRTGREQFTTKAMLAVERKVLREVNASQGQYLPVVSRTELAAAGREKEQAQGWTYTRGQKKAVEMLLRSPDRVNLVQGNAGAGKTAALGLVREVLAQRGVSVLGLGFTGKAAQELEKGAGIPSQTIDGFLLAEGWKRLP